MSVQCVKCTNDSVIAGCEGKKVAYCEPCYKSMLSHKFRSALGKRRVFKDGADKSALVVFDGTQAGAFLLGQLRDGLDEDAHRRLVVLPTVLGLISVFDLPRIREAERRISEIENFAPNWRWRRVHLAAILDPNEGFPDNPSELHGIDQVEVLRTFLAGVRSSTARAELKRILTNRLIIRIAQFLSITTILLPETADFLAKETLASLCLGRGGQVSEMTSPYEKKKTLPSMVRPLKEVRAKEVSIGLRLCGWEENVIYLEEDSPEATSIQKATEDFVDVLHNEGFAATVSTVLSTAGKVHLAGRTHSPCAFCLQSTSSSGLCPSCSVILDEVPDQSLISHLISTS